MAKLDLSIAIGDYDRTRPLADEAVHIDGVNPTFSLLVPEEIFFRAFRYVEFDVCELSLSSFSVKTAAKDCPYVGVPVFPSRAFRHTSVVIRNDRNIKKPEDLKGRRIGIPEYQLTANVWMRAILDDEHGVPPSAITWVRAGYDEPGRVEKIALKLPPDVKVEDAAETETLSSLLDKGDIDGMMGPRAPRAFDRGDPRLSWLYPDPAAVAAAWFDKRRLFPIMHIIGVRRTLVERHPWLPATLAKAFEQAKTLALAKLTDTSATKVTLPFVEEHLRTVRQRMGDDFWPYGFAANRNVLDYFLKQHHKQGLSSRQLAPEELFHSATLETFKI
jgi:4,5-dihydroxyphthalate decarboxylase